MAHRPYLPIAAAAPFAKRIAPPIRTSSCARRRYRQLAHFSRLESMKAGIHPEYQLANVHCSCGNQFYTRSTKEDLHVELCSECHPFYTGKQKLVDTGGRVERFQRRAAKHAKARK
jgi:large subunit ribosomal protein L31